MLKRIVFMIKKENAMHEMEPLLKELAAYGEHEHGYENHGRGIEVTFSESDALERELESRRESSKEGTLYITDCAACQKMLWERNAPVIVYLHEENRDEAFLWGEYAIEKIEEIEYKSLELAYLRLTGQPWDILTTNRCKIRETTIEDINSFYEIYKEPSITAYMEDLYADRDEEIAYIQDYVKNVYGFYGYGMWTVLEKASGQVIGRAGLSLREGYDIPELGFVIGVPWQRQGYAYEVCMAILAYGKEELGFTDFQTLIMEGNEKSGALCEKLGFTYLEKVEIDGITYERMILRHTD